MEFDGLKVTGRINPFTGRRQILTTDVLTHLKRNLPSDALCALAHCIYFKCVMNGSNHLAESDARPLSLCPVCLRKLQHTIGFDVLARYGRLLQFYRKAALKGEV
jgi:hypothetical protein